MPNKELENLIRKLDKGLELAELNMLREKALHNESAVYSDGKGNIIYALASDVLAERMRSHADGDTQASSAEPRKPWQNQRRSACGVRKLCVT